MYLLKHPAVGIVKDFDECHQNLRAFQLLSINNEVLKTTNFQILIVKYQNISGLLLKAGTQVPASAYFEHSVCLGAEGGRPKKSKGYPI